MKPLPLLLSFLLLFTSCKKNNENPPDGTILSKSYIQVYIDVEKISCQQMSDANYIHVMIEGNDIKYSDPAIGKYKELSEKFGDTDYNKTLVPYSNYAIANEFATINIISDKDFNTELPAGTSLSSIVTLVGASPYQYIKSGYTEPYDWRNAPEDYKANGITYADGYIPVHKSLSNITNSDLLLLERNIYLKFSSEPASNKEHTFTVTFKNNEKEISATVDMVFK